MKNFKTGSFISIACLLGWPVLAHSQSSVTLYGILDNSIVFSSNAGGSHQIQASSGSQDGDRFGFIGHEDLGGGYSADFQLENGFDANSGAASGGAMFGRIADVGLSNQYGSITLGRQFDPTCYLVAGNSAGASYYTPSAIQNQWATRYASHPADLSNSDGYYMVSNAIKISTNRFAGFSASALYSLGGIAGDASRNEVWSAAVDYASNNLHLGVGALVARDPNYSLFGNYPESNTATSANALNMANTIWEGYASARTYEAFSAGGTYLFGNATVSLMYNNVHLKDIGSEAGAGLNPRNLTGNATFNVYEASGTYNFTPAWLVGIDYSLTTAGGPEGDAAHYNQFTLGTVYSLSKRTNLYVDATYQRAAGRDSTGNAAVAQITAFNSPSSTNQQTIFLAGIRHLF